MSFQCINAVHRKSVWGSYCWPNVSSFCIVSRLFEQNWSPLHQKLAGSLPEQWTFQPFGSSRLRGNLEQVFNQVTHKHTQIQKQTHTHTSIHMHTQAHTQTDRHTQTQSQFYYQILYIWVSMKLGNQECCISCRKAFHALDQQIFAVKLFL